MTLRSLLLYAQSRLTPEPPLPLIYASLTYYTSKGKK